MADWKALIDSPSGPDGLAQASGSLDCASTPSIPAHIFITVQMHIAVPAAGGTSKFVWWLTGVTTATGEALTIVAR